MMRERVHRDVGKESPIAFCSGAEYGVACTEEWLHVTCAACHEKRHAGSPLSIGEQLSRTRAMAPGETRPLTDEEISRQRERNRDGH